MNFFHFINTWFSFFLKKNKFHHHLIHRCTNGHLLSIIVSIFKMKINFITSKPLILSFSLQTKTFRKNYCCCSGIINWNYVKKNDNFSVTFLQINISFISIQFNSIWWQIFISQKDIFKLKIVFHIQQIFFGCKKNIFKSL